MSSILLILDLSHACYICIKNKRLGREKVGPLKDKGGNLFLASEEVAEVLNEYFTLVFIEDMDVEDGEISKGYANKLGQIKIKSCWDY